MKLVIESHRFAPELNMIHFVNKKGEFIGSHTAPGITSVAQARAKYFAPVKPGKVAFVSASYSQPEYKWLDSQRTGRFESYAQLKDFVKKFSEGKQGGALLDGSHLESAKISVKTRLIG